MTEKTSSGRHYEPPPSSAASMALSIPSTPAEPVEPVEPAEPDPPAAAPAPASISEVVTCPECGATAEVYLNRRDASDFCARCDFPLFWTPSRVEREREAAGQGESLRRLPGTAGRSTLARATCPHCAEPNPVQATVCIRCGRSMQPVAVLPAVLPPPPPPAPVMVEVIPERGIPWWVWAVLAVVLAGLTLTCLVLTNVIG